MAILSIYSDLRLTPWSKLTSFSKITIGDFPQYLIVVYENYFHTSSYFRQSHPFKRFLTTTINHGTSLRFLTTTVRTDKLMGEKIGWQQDIDVCTFSVELLNFFHDELTPMYAEFRKYLLWMYKMNLCSLDWNAFMAEVSTD